MSKKTFKKDPESILDYSIDWSVWLNGDTISGSSWTVPSGLTEGSDSFTDTTTILWLSGGTAGESYSVVNRIDTASGRRADKTITIQCREK